MILVATKAAFDGPLGREKSDSRLLASRRRTTTPRQASRRAWGGRQSFKAEKLWVCWFGIAEPPKYPRMAFVYIEHYVGHGDLSCLQL